MNIEAVRAFVAVAEDGQFQHAAARLGVSQQAVSKRRLIEHVKRSFEPPAAGALVWLPRQARNDFAAAG